MSDEQPKYSTPDRHAGESRGPGWLDVDPREKTPAPPAASEAAHKALDLVHSQAVSGTLAWTTTPDGDLIVIVRGEAAVRQLLPIMQALEQATTAASGRKGP